MPIFFFKKPPVNLNLLYSPRRAQICVVPELLTLLLTDDLYKNAGKGGHLNWCGKSLPCGRG